MRLRIFVFDDEPCITESFRWHLEAQGHEVYCVSDPTLCSVYHNDVCEHKEACCDILIVGRHMPYMDGLTFLEHIANRECKMSPKNQVLMSGAFQPEDFAKAEALGIRVVHKPITLEELDRLITEMKENIPADRKLVPLTDVTPPEDLEAT